MEAQIQHLTRVMQEMAQRAEDQALRLAAAELRADQAAQEAANARAETATLHTRMQDNAEAMPRILTELTAAVISQKSSGKEHSLMDKAAGKPIPFDEKEEKFPGWRRRFENYIVGSYGEKFREVLNWATESEAAIESVTWDVEFGSISGNTVDDLDTKIHQLYALLVHLTEDDSNDIVCGSGDGNGLEAYRLLCRRWDPNLSSRKGNLLKQIIAPPRCKYEELQGALERWKEQVRRYERRRDDQGVQSKLDMDVKLSAIEMLVPSDIENHLTLNKYRIKGFEDALKEISFILDARTGSKLREPTIKGPGASASAGPQPMDIDALWQKGKDGKGKGGKGQKGKDGKGKGKPQQTSQTSPKFDGNCKNCEKYGHMAKDCWSKKADPKGGGKKGGGKGGGKIGAKGGKGGKYANSLEEPEAEAGAWDMGSLDQEDSTAGDEPACMSPLETRPTPDDWLRLNLDSGCALTTFPHRFGTGRGGNGAVYKTASGELIKDEGGVKLVASDEFDEMRKLTGRVANIHKPLISQSQCAKAGQRTYLDDTGGWMFSKDSKVGKEVSRVLQKEARKDKHGMMPIYEEKGVYNFYLKMGSGGSIAPLEESTVPERSSSEATIDWNDRDKCDREHERQIDLQIEALKRHKREVAELIAKRRSSGGDRPPDGV